MSGTAVRPGIARVPEALISELEARLGERLSTSAAVRDHHSRDESYHEPEAPDAVAFPESTEEVRAIVSLCARYRVPVISFGAGTSLEGHVLAHRGGVCLDMTRMNRVIRVSAEDMDATVEAGLTRKQLNHALRDSGLCFFIDPGADATIGGVRYLLAGGDPTEVEKAKSAFKSAFVGYTLAILAPVLLNIVQGWIGG